ncbi:hypothetical protein K1719_002064 [Acacia pycnantha]|nr:hypothetical protein K1719_002064 [Acacia pycnantha]
MVNNTGAFVLFVLLCAVWLSSARLHPGADEVNATSASMISAVTASTKSQQPAIIFGGENKSSSKKVDVETSMSSSPHYNEKLQKRRLRRNWSDEIDKGFVAFSADYHGPRHHPPKNN